MIGFDVLPEYAQSNRELLGEGLVLSVQPIPPLRVHDWNMHNPIVNS